MSLPVKTSAAIDHDTSQIDPGDRVTAQVDMGVVMAGEGGGAALALTQGPLSASAQQAKRSRAQREGREPSTPCLEPTRWSRSWLPTSAASRRL